MWNISYKITFTLLAAIVVPCFGRLALQGSGVEYELIRYLVPLGVGSIGGFSIGYLFDSRLRALKKLKEANIKLTTEIKERNKQEAWHRALFEKNHTIILLVNPKTGQIVDANPKAGEFYGYSTEQLKQMKISEINTLSEKEISKVLRQAWLEKKQQFYFKHRLASGEERDVEIFTGSITVDNKPLLLSMVKDITELKLLRGIIPICSSCKQIRDGKGYWSQVESYIQRHSEANFSHGLCPTCVETLYPEINGAELKY